jgi:hypothetical protein
MPPDWPPACGPTWVDRARVRYKGRMANSTDKPTPDQPTSDQPAAEEDETQRKFREALERKNAKNKAAHGEDHLSGHGVGYAANDTRKRQFRRKSGG